MTNVIPGETKCPACGAHVFTDFFLGLCHECDEYRDRLKEEKRRQEDAVRLKRRQAYFLRRALLDGKEVG